MKLIKFITLCLMAFFMVNCSLYETIIGQDDDVDPIMLSKSEIFFESATSSETITITYNGEWRLEGETEWCTATPNYGAGDAEIIISVSENEETEQREVEFVFYDKSNNETVLKIVQYELVKTNYVDISWEETSFSYDADSGQIIVSGEVEVDVGKVLVLPIEIGGYIRIIESISNIGGNTIIGTSPGYMQDLFCDIEFTLVTSEDAATKAIRSSGGRIITPSKIYATSGSDINIIYDIDNPNTRSVPYDGKYGFNVDSDFSGYTVFQNDYLDVFFEKAICNYGVNFVYELKFGKAPTSLQEFKGEFEYIKAYLEGNLYMDYLAKCIANGEYSKKVGYDEVLCFKEKVIDDLKFTFYVKSGVIKVPVYVTISTDLCGLGEIEAEAEAILSGGFSFSATSQLGLEYDDATDIITPIASFNKEFDSYPLTLSAYGTINNKISLYPKFNIIFYSLAGPSIEPIPYIETDLKTGFLLSADGENNYYGWQGELNSGMKYRLGFSYDFLGLLKDDKYTDVYDATSFYTKITKDPVSIKLSEDNHSELSVGEKVNVTFETLGYNNLTFNYYASSSVYVIFETDGIISNEIVVSDENGLATVSWTPINTSQSLNARIVDKDGETISEVTYAPEITYDATYKYLINFTADSYPDYDTWTIYDETATTADFAGLSAALATVAKETPDREISLVFPDLTTIPNYAIFGTGASSDTYDSSAVVSLTADSATSIGDYSFYKCTSLKVASIRVATYIGYYSFFGCTSLTTVYLSELENIELDDAFTDCDNLCNVVSGGSSSSSGSGSGSGSSFGTSFGTSIGGFSDNEELTEVGAQGVIEIWDYAFYNCISLRNIDLSNVKKIGKYAFGNCKSLPSFDFPDAAIIDENAFSGCSAIDNAELPSLTSLSDSVFDSCSSLANVSLPQVTSIGSLSFANCSSLTTLELATGSSTDADTRSTTVDGVKITYIAPDAFSNTDTSQIDLILSSPNSIYVKGNILTVGEFSAEFNSIAIPGDLQDIDPGSTL